MSPLSKGIVRMVRWYQLANKGRVSPCRFQPTCSSYAIEAVQSRGALVGTGLALRRLSRCHPLGGHGWDPVPPKKVTSRC